MTAGVLDELKNFDFDNSNVHLWVFKTGQSAQDKKIPRYTGRWVSIGPELVSELKNIANSEVSMISEVHDYSLLAQNNESSALHIPLELTHADIIINSCSEEVESKRVKHIKDLKNNNIYIAKYVNHGEVFYGVKKAPDNWSLKKRRGVLALSYQGDMVEVAESESFDLAKIFDVIFWGGHVLALREKAKFESIFKYKEAHIEYFSELCTEPEFVDVFSDVGPLSKYVGNNKMQLRRAAAIQQKGYYRDSAFVESLKNNLPRLQLNITFGDDGKIHPCDLTCPDIFKALLEHRLLSHYQDRPFDVPDSVSV